MASARRVATNLSVRAELVQRARAAGLNLSEVFERAVSEALHDTAGDRWLAKNRAAIDTYNASVARRGSFGDRWRRF